MKRQTLHGPNPEIRPSTSFPQHRLQSFRLCVQPITWLMNLLSVLSHDGLRLQFLFLLWIPLLTHTSASYFRGTNMIPVDAGFRVLRLDLQGTERYSTVPLYGICYFQSGRLQEKIKRPGVRTGVLTREDRTGMCVRSTEFACVFSCIWHAWSRTVAYKPILLDTRLCLSLPHLCILFSNGGKD